MIDRFYVTTVFGPYEARIIRSDCLAEEIAPDSNWVLSLTRPDYVFMCEIAENQRVLTAEFSHDVAVVIISGGGVCVISGRSRMVAVSTVANVVCRWIFPRMRTAMEILFCGWLMKRATREIPWLLTIHDECWLLVKQRARRYNLAANRCRSNNSGPIAWPPLRWLIMRPFRRYVTSVDWSVIDEIKFDPK